MTDFFKNTGLDLREAAPTLQRKITKREFENPFGDDEPLTPADRFLKTVADEYLESALSKFPKQTFKKGDRVKHRGSASITGTVFAQSGNEILVDWDKDLGRSIHDSRMLERV